MKEKVKAMKDRKLRASSEKVENGSGNVFADLGFQDAEERLLKAKLATRIAELIEKKGWTQDQTAERTALDPSKWLPLLRRQLSGFSRDDLCAILNICQTRGCAEIDTESQNFHVYYTGWPSG